MDLAGALLAEGRLLAVLQDWRLMPLSRKQSRHTENRADE